MEELINLINSSDYLLTGDKSFLLDVLSGLSPVDKLKLKHSLLSKQAPALLKNLHTLRDKFKQIETPKEPDLITKAVQRIIKPTPPKILSHSFLSQPALLGSPVPKSPQFSNVKPLNSLKDIVSLSQLKLISPNHINFNPNQNAEVEIQDFVEIVEVLMDKIKDVPKKRDQYMYFISSNLFNAYIDTGLTALRHPELKPNNVILNTLSQIDAKYLNGKQFKYAGLLNNQLKSLCGL
jgi:hypothetical protein